MAIGIDLGFIALEIAQPCAVTPVKDQPVRSAGHRQHPRGVGGDERAGVWGASDWLDAYSAVGLGIAIPALIYALSRVAFGLSVALT